MKNGQVEGFTEVAPALQHARAALPVCASAVKSVVSQIAAAKPAPTSPGTQKLKSCLQNGSKQNLVWIRLGRVNVQNGLK
ncbi:hypothetical protein OIU79_024355 [Salix purpurea]|uniref:Uncharacterized protein n=1 Tax=Salix purpurea TaxID=77065 RepID=A0A9Q0WC43_SALPP|nr:hypothetical protein OIU79_024355 [Salix purpurea]